MLKLLKSIIYHAPLSFKATITLRMRSFLFYPSTSTDLRSAESRFKCLSSEKSFAAIINELKDCDIDINPAIWKDAEYELLNDLLDDYETGKIHESEAQYYNF